ncbi:hypothetical protein ACFE04_008426 [Oxalis oulophora]
MTEPSSAPEEGAINKSRVRVKVEMIYGNSARERILHGSSPSKLIEHYTETIGRHPQLPEWIISGAFLECREEQKLSVMFGMSCTFSMFPFQHFGCMNQVTELESEIVTFKNQRDQLEQTLSDNRQQLDESISEVEKLQLDLQ